MESVTLSTKYQLVIPRLARTRMGLRPGARFAVIEKGGILYLIPEHPVRAWRGIARGTSPRDLRSKKDRL